MKDKFLLILLISLGFTILYVIIFESDNRDKYYHIKTNESFYLSKKVEIDSNNCLIFVDEYSEKKVKVCGNYEIKNPKQYEFEN
jgi:hypothetical protein